MSVSETLERILDMVSRQEVRISLHGYEELAADGILVKDVLAGVGEGVVVEDYPDYPKGPCVLVLQLDHERKPIHIVWGIPRGASGPAVVVTGYRPKPERWSKNLLRRQT